MYYIVCNLTLIEVKYRRKLDTNFGFIMLNFFYRIAAQKHAVQHVVALKPLNSTLLATQR